MTFLPIVATRFATNFSINTGSALAISSLISWPSVTVDLGNEGDETEPPTRAYVNVVNETDTNSIALGGRVAILLPISTEGIFEPEPPGPGGTFILPQFRRPIAYQSATRHRQL